MHALHLLYIPSGWVLVPQNYPPDVETWQVQVHCIPEITTGFWEDDEHEPRIRCGGQLLLEVQEPNNFSRLVGIKNLLLQAVEQCRDAEFDDGYPEWLRFRLEQALEILQGDIEGRRLPNGLPAWNPATKTSEIREVA